MNQALYEEILRATHRFDAGETATVSRDLLQVLAKTYDVKYPGMKSRQFIPMMGGGVSAGAEAVAYHQYDQYGAAKIISKNAKDIPRVDVSKAEFTSPVKTLAAAYGYEWHELKRAAQSGVSLTEMRAKAARRAIEQGIDDVMATGDAVSGLEGFINHSAVDINAATYGAMSANSAEDNYKELAEVCSLIESQTKGVHMVSGIILPISQYQKVATQPWSTTASELTVLEFFKRNHPGVSVDHWHKLTDAAANGTDDRMIAYARDPEVVEGILPLDFEQLPPEAQGLELVINCLARVGGVQVRYPLAIQYIDGV